MIGSLDRHRREVLVVGAGVSGLLAAYALDREGYTVTLCEASDRVGGLIRTEKLTDAQGNLLGIAEAAAHSLLVTDEVEALCRDLGVELFSLRSRGRYIYRAMKMMRFPLTFKETLEMILRALFVPSFLPPQKQTLSEWGHRHLGVAATENLLAPFVRGVYGVTPSEICVAAAFPSLRIPTGLSLALRMLPRLFGKRSRMVSCAGGMEDLVKALEKRLRQRLGGRFQLGRKVEVLPTDVNVVLALPAKEAAKFVDESSAGALRLIQYTPLVSCTVIAECSAFRKLPEGVGVLMTPSSKTACYGILFNSSSFADRVTDEQKYLSLSMMYPVSIQSEQLESQIRGDLNILFGFDLKSPLTLKLNRHENAIPKYDGTLMNAWERLKAGICSKPGFVVAGNWTGQVSLRGMIGDSVKLPHMYRG